MEVSGRGVKLVEWQEHDRHGEETAGRFGEYRKQLKQFGAIILDCIGVDSHCRRRNAMAIVPEGGGGGGASGRGGTADSTTNDTDTIGSGVGVSILMGVKRAAKTFVRASKRRIGWAGLPPRIELIIDLEARQLRSAVFTVDSSLRPDMTEIEMASMLCRLFIQHLENAECVKEGTAIKLWPRPKTPGGTLVEGRG